MVVRCMLVEKICLYYFRILLKSSFLIIILEVGISFGYKLITLFFNISKNNLLRWCNF